MDAKPSQVSQATGVAPHLVAQPKSLGGVGVGSGYLSDEIRVILPNADSLSPTGVVFSDPQPINRPAL